MPRIHPAFDYQAAQAYARELRRQEIDRLFQKAFRFIRDRLAARRQTAPRTAASAASSH